MRSWYWDPTLWFSGEPWAMTGPQLPLFDDVVRAGKQRSGNRHLHHLGCLKIYDQLELTGALNWQVAGARTFKNPGNIVAEAAIKVGQVWAIGDQAAAVGKRAERRYSGYSVIQQDFR